MIAAHLAVVTGMLAAAGLVLLIAELIPGPPHLATALTRLAPHAPTTTPEDTTTGLQDRLGRLVHTQLGIYLRVPTTDLAICGVAPHTWVGEKVLIAMLGLLTPVILTAVSVIIGLTPPLYIPAAASLALAALFFFLPDLSLRSRATKARVEFVRGLAAYMELAALARVAGAGVRMAMETAASDGDTFPFRRIGESLLRARLTNQPPWAGLSDLAADLAVPELDELASMLRQAVEQEAPVEQSLRARAASIRSRLLADEQARAGAVTEQMAMPTAAAALVFVILLMAPALMRITTG